MQATNLWLLVAGQVSEIVALSHLVRLSQTPEATSSGCVAHSLHLPLSSLLRRAYLASGCIARHESSYAYKLASSNGFNVKSSAELAGLVT